MSSIAKANISLSKKDLTKSRIPLVSSRNIAFYHKATAGSLSINLLALSMPSEMPTMVQATADEISGARLLINKKNLSLVSSANGPLIQGMDYVVTSSTTIQLIGLYGVSGAEADEIFVGTINSAPVSDIVVASARSVDKTYTLAVGQTTLNLGREYEVGMNPNDDIGSIKVFVNGVLAHRGSDYAEVDAGSGYGTTISFFSAPVSIPYSVAVDFGVMSISDNDAIGTMESLSGAIVKIAADLADVAGTSATDYLTANPSEVERRTFGDMVLVHEKMLDISIPMATSWVSYTPTLTTLTASTTSARWRQVGQNMEINFRIVMTGTPAATTGVTISLPGGYTVDTLGGIIDANLGKIGYGHLFDSSAFQHFNLQCLYNGGIFLTYQAALTGQVVGLTNTAPISLAVNDTIEGTITVPIVEFLATQTIRQLLGL